MTEVEYILVPSAVVKEEDMNEHILHLGECLLAMDVQADDIPDAVRAYKMKALAITRPDFIDLCDLSASFKGINQFWRTKQ